MIALYDHIQQLRAELSNNGDAEEIRQIRDELAIAQAAQVKLDAEFAAWLEEET